MTHASLFSGIGGFDLAAEWMLKTPSAMDSCESLATAKKNPTSGNSGCLAQEIANGYATKMGTSLTAMAVNGMFPTPSARDWKGRTNPGIRKEGCGNIYGETLPDAIYRISQNSQLNPLFVAEMMGFPTDWTLAPFLNGLKSINDGDSAAGGAENPSKPTVTP